MPAAGPSYPAGPYRFINREFLVITYETDAALIRARLSKTQINRKMIPGVDGHLVVCQLVAINLTDIGVKGSWVGPGRLHLVPHVNAPVADFPVRRVAGAHHFLADLTLPFGRVVHDYNKEDGQIAPTGLAAE